MNNINGKVGMTPISDIDLNQLRLLQLIFETKNLTRAGERAGLTQSAVSHTLKKLRHSFNDTLVMRQGNKLVMTPRAEALQIPLNRWLNDFERTILNHEVFDPAHSSRTFYVGTSDLVEQSLAGPLIGHLGRLAPHVHLVFSKLDKRSFASQIESGEVDFIISVADTSHPGLMVRALYQDDFVCVARRGHPFLKGPQDIQQFCRYPHILAGTGRDNRGMVDDALEVHGLHRTVQYKVANFSSAPYLVESSDCLFTGPRQFITAVAGKFDLEMFELPLCLESYTMKIYWNIRDKDDQANRWMREQITEVGRLVTPVP